MANIDPTRKVKHDALKKFMTAATGKQRGTNFLEVQIKARFLVSSPDRIADYYLAKIECVVEDLETKLVSLQKTFGNKGMPVVAATFMVDAISEVNLNWSHMLLRLAANINEPYIKDHLEVVDKISKTMTNSLARYIEDEQN